MAACRSKEVQELNSIVSVLAAFSWSLFSFIQSFMSDT